VTGGNSFSSSESKVAPFDKDTKLSDKHKFDSWSMRLQTRLNKATGRFASCLFHVQDPSHPDKCWGMKGLQAWGFNDDVGAVDKLLENVNSRYKA
jgi:hypothetical protein